MTLENATLIEVSDLRFSKIRERPYRLLRFRTRSGEIASLILHYTPDGLNMVREFREQMRGHKCSISYEPDTWNGTMKFVVMAIYPPMPVYRLWLTDVLSTTAKRLARLAERIDPR